MKKMIFSGSSLFITIILMSVLITFTGCKKEDDVPNPPANEVYIQNSAFYPSTLNISVNTTVKWTNKEWTTHTVTSDTGVFDSGSITVNGTFSFQFTTAGTFNYHCTLHPNMKAKVVVN